MRHGASGVPICLDCSDQARRSAVIQELGGVSRMVAVWELRRPVPRLRAHSDAGRHRARRGTDARASAIGEGAIRA